MPPATWASAGGGKNGHLRPLEIGIKNQKYKKKTEVSSLTPISWFNSCNDSLFAGMRLTLHKSQVHVMVSCSDELAVHSCPLLCLQWQVAKLASELFYCWSLLRNNDD